MYEEWLAICTGAVSGICEIFKYFQTIQIFSTFSSNHLMLRHSWDGVHIDDGWEGQLSADGNAGDHEFPTFSSATFAVWYRTMVRDIQFHRKPRAGIKPQSVEQLLVKLGQSVNVVVSPINMCKTFN